MKILYLISGFLATAMIAFAARAAIIPGPSSLSAPTTFSVTGLEFTALTDTTLTGFTFSNLGRADTVYLTNSSGAVLDSVSTPAAETPDAVTVAWELTEGRSYFLLEDSGSNISNGEFADYSDTLPSDSDIEMTISGAFGDGLAGVAADPSGGIPYYTDNAYWADFTNLTTGAAIPEPALWIMMALGVGLLGAALRSARRRIVAP
jgi:hypothetical protein